MASAGLDNASMMGKSTGRCSQFFRDNARKRDSWREKLFAESFCQNVQVTISSQLRQIDDMAALFLFLFFERSRV